MKVKPARLLLLPVCLLAGVAFSMSGAQLSTVLLIATLNNAPALQPVLWEVTNLDNDEVVSRTRRHSLTLRLKQGHYKAVATFGEVSRQQTFTATAAVRIEVVLSMD